ncbi:MAG: hypothetical protein WC777_01800 [Candidatus Gracilibacteria bacterium]
MQVKALIQSPIVREVLIFAGLLGAALLVSQLLPGMSFANGFIDDSDNLDIVGDATNNEGDLKELIKDILNYFLGFLGFVATVMVIYGGVLYITDGGSDENVGKAKKILMYAAIGIILILISFALVNTILGAGLGGGASTSTTTVNGVLNN